MLRATRPEPPASFEEWYAAVGREISRIAGVGADDLPDRHWRAAFDAGDSPADAARDALEEDGFPVDD